MILVTGATGFVGRALVNQLLSNGPSGGVVAAVRSSNPGLHKDVRAVQVGDLLPDTNWNSALKRVDAVMHCAARVHVMQESAQNPLEAFRHVNVAATLNLARQAAAAGVKRFVFVSSIGVNGAETFSAPFVADGVPSPHSPYAVSKHEAELGLQALAHETGLEVVIVRPPLVYGLDAPGNFGSLVRWLKRGVPLPLGAVQSNRRSLVSLDNLVDFLSLCVLHPAAANQTFLVSDGEDVSTTSLLRGIGSAMGKPATLLPVPAGLLKLGAVALGKTGLAQQLLGSLQVDISKNRQLLGWQPPVSLDEGLRRAVVDFV